VNEIKKIPWKRISVEGVAIVTSILFAFAIDAWWQNRLEQVSDNTHLATVVTELRAHEVLLAEAISSHKRTIVAGAELLEIFSPSPSAESVSRAPQAIADLMRFYHINAPFGALETAMSAGAIARMKNTELASALANWPVVIDDLLEEQGSGRNHMFSFMAKMSDVTPMSDAFNLQLFAPRIRGTNIVVDAASVQLAPSQFQFDADAVQSSHELEAALLMLITLAQSAEAEATVFSAQLRTLIERLEVCLAEPNC
jgi:hypothetical protein